MKFSIVLVVVLVAVLAYTEAAPSKGSTKASLTNKKKQCLQDCDKVEYAPVCGGDGSSKNLSFGSECVLNNYNCENGKQMKVVQKGECPGGGGIRLQ